MVNQQNYRKEHGWIAIFACVALLVASGAAGHCQAPFLASAPKLRPSPQLEGRVSLQAELARLKVQRSSNAPVLPPSDALREDREFKQIHKASMSTSQADLLRAALLTAALLREQNWNVARGFLNDLDIQNPSKWEFDSTDDIRTVSDAYPSRELLLLYLSTARSFARLSAQKLGGAELWTEFSGYVGGMKILGRLGWNYDSPLQIGELPAVTASFISAEIRRLDSLERWESQAEISGIATLTGLSRSTGNQPALFGESVYGKFSVSPAGSGGGILIQSDWRCHDDYIGGFYAVAERFKEHRSKFEMASVVMSAGMLVVQLTPEFANSIGVREGGRATPHFVLSNEDFALLRAGSRVSDASNLGKAIANLVASKKALVFWQHALAQKSNEQSPGGQAEVLHEFVAALNRAYPELGVFKDPPGDELPERVAALHSAQLDKMPVRVIIDLAFGVPLTEAVNEVADDFVTRGGIEVVQYQKDTKSPTSTTSEPSTTVVITGSSGDQLAKLVRDLGTKGFLRNNFVIFEACGTELTARLVAEIVGRFGAKAVYNFSGPINPNDAANLLRHILIDKSKGKSSSLHSLPSTAIKALPKEPARPMIGAWTICSSISKHNDVLAAA